MVQYTFAQENSNSGYIKFNHCSCLAILCEIMKKNSKFSRFTIFNRTEKKKK